MTSSLASSPVAAPRWREVVWPKEHGSWSLVLEPLALGLLAAPSASGVAFAAAALAGFFARRPLRIAVHDAKPARRLAARRAVTALGATALAAFGIAVALAGASWLAWLLPTVVAGAAFLYFDLQQAGREQAAEMAGAAAFSWLPAVVAVLAGVGAVQAVTLAALMLARSIPTVLTVRAAVRARKSGEWRIAGPVVTSIVALAGLLALARTGLAPWTACVLVAMLALRSAVLLVYPRVSVRPSTLGMIEAATGAVYVLAVAVAWRI